MLPEIMRGYQWGSRFSFVEPPQTPLGVSGNTLGRGIGTSLEFMEHREYVPGDDPRMIDWNAYARSDRLAVKLYREEVNPHVELLVDASRSMNLPETKKGEATFSLVGFFAAAAAESRFSFRIFTTGDGCRPVERSHLLPTDWDPFVLDAVRSPADAIAAYPPNWRKRGIRIFLSDLMFLADPDLLLSQISRDAAVTIVVQLLARDDTEPPQSGNLKLVDSETGLWMETFLDPAAQNRYKANLTKHRENYNLAARRQGAIFCTLIAEEFLESQRIDDLLRCELLRQK